MIRGSEEQLSHKLIVSQQLVKVSSPLHVSCDFRIYNKLRKQLIKRWRLVYGLSKSLICLIFLICFDGEHILSSFIFQRLYLNFKTNNFISKFFICFFLVIRIISKIKAIMVYHIFGFFIDTRFIMNLNFFNFQLINLLFES